MTLEEFAVELAYLQELYEPCCQLSERMVQEWYAKLRSYNAPYLHEAIGEWMEANSYDPPVLKDVVRLTDVMTRRHQRQEAAEAQKQWEQEQAKVPVEERAAVLNTATRRLMVQQWPEYRQYWPDVAALEVDA
jgi:hypothetical protein